MSSAQRSGSGNPRPRFRWGLPVVALAVALGVALPVAGSAKTNANACAGTSNLTNFVAYTCGKAGAANSSLSPIKIGWVNNQGGTIAPVGLSSTKDAEFAVKFINEKLGGIGGHPLELSECFVKNAEDEGLKCAQQFLNDPAVMAVAYGAVAVGANTISSTLAGKKPIIMAYSLNPPDLKAKNLYILFGAGAFTVYGWGSFAKNVLHAKTAAVLYPQGPGLEEEGAGVKAAAEAAGIKTKAVGFNPQSSDLTGALTAAGAQSADMIAPILATGNNCLAVEKAIKQLRIDESKVVGFTQCTDPSLKKAYGGDFPKWNYGLAQSGDLLANPPTPVGAAVRKVLSANGLLSNVTDPWFPATFSEILTIAQFMNRVGADSVTPAAITARAKAFKGPLLLGPFVVQCGKYPGALGLCGDGDAFFRYLGNGKWKQLVRWLEPPVALQKKLHAKRINP
jgi:branched-chain amino acid transport system substrate-binding protein